MPLTHWYFQPDDLRSAITVYETSSNDAAKAIPIRNKGGSSRELGPINNLTTTEGKPHHQAKYGLEYGIGVRSALLHYVYKIMLI